MKKTFIFIAILAVLLLGFFLLEQRTDKQGENKPAPAESAAAFQEELTTRGVAAVGQPIEGFDAFLLLRAFPGLEEADFAGVASFEGSYQFEGGELAYERTADQPVTSAEQTISEEGYITLLSAVSQRLDLSAETPEDARAIVDVLASGGSQTGEPITISGQISCLPKVGDGPQTMECAIGLEADDGSYYSLQTPADAETNHQFLSNGTQVEVIGTLINEEQYGPDGNRYDTVGTIIIEEVSEQ